MRRVDVETLRREDLVDTGLQGFSEHSLERRAKGVDGDADVGRPDICAVTLAVTTSDDSVCSCLQGRSATT